MEALNGHVMNLANSIIGVSVLAMPYCFKQCGIILSVLLLLISSIVSRLTCHFLLKSAIISRRRTFEFLAFHLFGGLGKLAIEIGMIGFLLGTCIAYFVVMGDLGPVIISEITKSHISSTMHTSILMALALFIVLPLGLLRNVHSLNGVSRATMVFYCCLVLKVIIEALPKIFSDDWLKDVNLWEPEGLLQCIPIFSMALFCQTQLFEIYEVVPNPTLDKMNNLIRIAVNFCTGVYICVGIFGYIAFSHKDFTGNVLLSFEPSFISHVLKVGFIFSVAFSFPLVIFPCRASLYSLLYKEGYSVHEGSLNYIAEGKFKALTFIIVFVSLIIAILIPNIELVLGLVGSTIGVMVCVLFPVTCFICVSQKNTNERVLAQIILAVGIFVMVVGTYKNIQRVDQLEPVIVTSKTPIQAQPDLGVENIIKKLPLTEKLEIRTEKLKETQSEINNNNNKEVRHEPPQPIEPVDEAPQKQIIQKQNETRNDEVDIEAIKKEDKEEQLEKKDETNDDHKVLIDTIQKQNEVQKAIVEQQKQLLEVIKKQQKTVEEKKMDEVKQEKMKAVKEIESIALKAIEKISEGEDSKKVVEDLKKGVEKKEHKITNEEVKENVFKEGQRAEKEFEKKVDNFKMEIQELSSKLNQVGIEMKNKEETLKHDPVDGIRKEEKINNNNSENKLPKMDSPFENTSKNGSQNLKLGKKEVKITDENDPSRILPLPIAISNNSKKNAFIPEILPVIAKDEEKKILEKKHVNEEVQAMRRDILSLSTRK